MNTNLNNVEIAAVLAQIEASNALSQQLMALIGHDVELPAKDTTATQFLADLTATEADEPEPVEQNPNKVLAAWLRANGFEPNGEPWAVSKALVRDGMSPEQALTAMVGGTPVAPNLTAIPVVVKSTPKAASKPKTPKAKAAPKVKKVHPPIACGDCGVIVPEPTWNQRYCATHSAERKNVFQSMLDQHRAAAK